jgi:hypothetical protein
MECMLSTPRVPRQTGWPERTAKRNGRLATASLACKTERDIETANPGKQAPKKKDCDVQRVHGDVQPTASVSACGSVCNGCVLDYGAATQLPGRALGVHQAAVVTVQQERASRAPTTS